jgi:hypothetical protein
MVSQSKKSPSATISPPPSELVPQHSVQWVTNKGRYYVFKPSSSHTADNDPEEVLEFETVGTFTRAFLEAGAKSHTIIVNIGFAEIDRIKSVIRSVPNF